MRKGPTSFIAVGYLQGLAYTIELLISQMSDYTNVGHMGIMQG